MYNTCTIVCNAHLYMHIYSSYLVIVAGPEGQNKGFGQLTLLTTHTNKYRDNSVINR